MIRLDFHKTLIFLGLLFCIQSSFADKLNEKGQKLLAALGGEAVWKNVVAVHNTAVNHHPQSRLPYIQEYWYFTNEPRHVIKINNHDMHRMRSYNEEAGWSMVDGDIRPFDEERMAREIQSWHRSMYRKLLLLANQSPDLKLRAGDDGSLEFFESERFLGWMMIDEQGAPTRHGGSTDREVFTAFKELIQFGDAYWPGGGEDESGWRFEMLSLELLDEEPEIETEIPLE